MGIFSIFFNKKSNKAPQPINQVKAETGKSHSKIFKVAGVTFGNRQNNLKKLLELKLKGKVLNINMEQYDYQGEPAVKIVVNGLDIGNLHSKDVEFVLQNKDRIIAIKDLYIGDFEEDNKMIYYAKITLLIKNKT